MNLDWARMVGGSAIIVGMPRDLPDELNNELPNYLSNDDVLGVAQTNCALNSSADACTRLKRSDGLSRVPQWLRIGSEYTWFRGIEVAFLIHYLNAFEDRLVSLDATSRNQQPIRYIEFSHSPYEQFDGRWFAEVELWLDEHNTFRIEILNFRLEPITVRASPFVS